MTTTIGKRVGIFEWGTALRSSKGAPLALRGFMHTMATHADTKTGENIRPSLTRLSEAIGIDRRTAGRHADEAVRLGWFELVEDNSNRGVPSVYRLTIPADGSRRECRTPLGMDVAGGATGMSQGVRQECRTTSSSTSSPTYSDTSSPSSVWEGLDEPGSRPDPVERVEDDDEPVSTWRPQPLDLTTDEPVRTGYGFGPRDRETVSTGRATTASKWRSWD